MANRLRAARRALHLAALAALASSQPAHAGDAPERRPRPATHVRAVEPRDGAVRVSVLSDIRIDFDGPLDPASVTRAHVVVASSGVTIASALSYDPWARRIALRPIAGLEPLAHDATYTVTLSGLQDADGRAVAPFSSRFSTTVNPVVQDFLNEVGEPGDHVFRRYVGRYELDARGHPVRYVQRYTDDPDATPGPDDPVSQYILYEYDDAGRLKSKTWYRSPGRDSVWFTADDPWTERVTQTYAPNGAPLVNETDYADFDVNAQYQNAVTAVYDTGGQQIGTIKHTPGGYGYINSPQDAITHDTWTLDGYGRLIRIDHFDTEGNFVGHSNRVWSVPCRVLRDVDYLPLLYDSNGNPIHDAIIDATEYVYGARGDLVRSVADYLGPDGVWFTADDIPEQYTGYEANAAGDVSRASLYFSPGADGVWFDADDFPASGEVHDTRR